MCRHIKSGCGIANGDNCHIGSGSPIGIRSGNQTFHLITNSHSCGRQSKVAESTFGVGISIDITGGQVTPGKIKGRAISINITSRCGTSQVIQSNGCSKVNGATIENRLR